MRDQLFWHENDMGSEEDMWKRLGFELSNFNEPTLGYDHPKSESKLPQSEYTIASTMF